MSIDTHSLLFWLFIWSQLYSYVMILGANSALNGLSVTLLGYGVKVAYLACKRLITMGE